MSAATSNPNTASSGDNKSIGSASPPTEYIIRAATPHDWPRVVAMHILSIRAHCASHYDAEQIRVWSDPERKSQPGFVKRVLSHIFLVAERKSASTAAAAPSGEAPTVSATDAVAAALKSDASPNPILGFIEIDPAPAAKPMHGPNPEATLHACYVAVGAQRTGVGRSLVKRALEVVHERRVAARIELKANPPPPPPPVAATAAGSTPTAAAATGAPTAAAADTKSHSTALAPIRDGPATATELLAVDHLSLHAAFNAVPFYTKLGFKSSGTVSHTFEYRIAGTEQRGSVSIGAEAMQMPIV